MVTSCGDNDAGLGVEGVLDVGAEDIRLGGLLGGPAKEVGQEDQAGHGVELLGGPAPVRAEMVSQFVDGHEFEEDMSKDALPAVGDDALARGGDNAVEGVGGAGLSGVDGVNHNGRNSWVRL
jgi:hypothetical protein